MTYSLFLLLTRRMGASFIYSPPNPWYLLFLPPSCQFHSVGNTLEGWSNVTGVRNSQCKYVIKWESTRGRKKKWKEEREREIEEPCTTRRVVRERLRKKEWWGWDERVRREKGGEKEMKKKSSFFFFWRCWSLLSINSGRPTNRRPPTVFPQGSSYSRSCTFFTLLRFKGKITKTEKKYT